MSEQNFPLYRCYSNRKSFFLIQSESQMKEWQVIGGFYTTRELNAKILPERNLIMDLIEMNTQGIESLEAHEFEKLSAEIEQSLKFREL